MAWIAVVLLVISGFPSAVRNPTLAEQPHAAETTVSSQETSCAVPASQDDDARAALAVAGGVFQSTVWSAPTTNGDYAAQMTVTWLSDWLGAVAFLEYLHYDCGVTSQDIEQWGTPKGFKVIFENFSSYLLTAQCQRNGVQLFEFDVVTTYGANDHALYWVKQVSPKRIAAFDLILPDSYHAKQVGYARLLFPELPTCSG